MSDQEKRRQAVDTIARHMIVQGWWDGELQDPPGIHDETLQEVLDRGHEIVRSIAVSPEQYAAALAHLRETAEAVAP